MEKKKLDIFGLSELAKNFNIEVAEQYDLLNEWLRASYELKPNQLELLKSIFEKVQVNGNYMILILVRVSQCRLCHSDAGPSVRHAVA